MDSDMDEIREDLKRIMEVLKANNAVLRSIQSRARWSMIFSVLRWLVIIGVAIGAYYYLQPYLQQLADVYQKVTGTQADFMNIFKNF